MKYNKYELKDFLQDEYFIAWVTNPDAELELFWDNWIRSHSEARKTVQQAREIIQSIQFTTPKASQSDREEVLTKVLKGYESVYKYKLVNKRRRWSQILKIAASLAVISLIGLGAYNFIQQQQAPVETPVIKTIVKNNPAGRKSQITLPDGTLVHLNAESTVSYPERFTGKSRKVLLSGEAYFEVVKGDIPFVVHNGILKAMVLGTSFNFNDNSISLLTGKVEVSSPLNDTQPIVLTPGQKVVHDQNKNSIFKTSYNYQQEMGWKDGIIFFEDADFNYIRKRLERWYGVKIEILSGEKFNWTYTGTFENASLERVLERLAYLESFDFELENNVVRIF